MNVKYCIQPDPCQVFTVVYQGQSYEVPPMPEFKPGSTTRISLMRGDVDFVADPRGDREMDWRFWCLAHRVWGKSSPRPLLSNSSDSETEELPINETDAAKYQAIMEKRLSPEAEEMEIKRLDAARLLAHNATFSAVRGEVAQSNKDASTAFVRQGERLKAMLAKEEGITRRDQFWEYAQLMGRHLYPDAMEHAAGEALAAMEKYGMKPVKLAVIELLNEDIHGSKRVKFLDATAKRYFETKGAA